MLRFAVIGSNFITDRFLAAAGLCGEFSLAAYYSRDKERARLRAEQHGAPLWFDSLEDLAACPQVDAVYVASPNSLHMRQAVQMLERGKHVLCEKPVASNTREWQRMKRAAAEGGRLVLEAMRPFYAPGLEVIRQALPRLGTVRRVSFSYCQYSSRYDKFKAGIVENAFNPAFSNGALMDLGCYCAAPLAALFGMPQELHASPVLLENGVDGAGTILARYPGMVAELIYSKITESRNCSEIQGERGSLLIKRISTPQELSIHWQDGTSETLPVEQQPHDILYELKEFIRLAKQPELAEPYHRWSDITMAIMEEARRQMGIVYAADQTEELGI